MSVSNTNYQSTIATQVIKSAILLVALFILSLDTVFAEESVGEVSISVTENQPVATSETLVQTETTEVTPSPGSEPVPVGETSQEEIQLEEPPMAMSSMTMSDDGYLTSVSTVDNKVLPKINGNTGAVQYEFNFNFPLGRGPSFSGLSLMYSNQNASDGDEFGYGWKLSLPYIELINKTGIENLYSTSSIQYFSSSLSGELSRQGTSTTYFPKIDQGDYLTYTKTGDSWILVDRNGLTYTFGQTAQSRLDNPGNSSQIYRWMIERIEDTNGNYVTFTYIKSTGVIYPESVQYSGYGSDVGVYEIEFTLASTTPKTTYEKRFASTRSYVVSKLELKTNGILSKRYDFEYGDGIGEKRDLLTGVTETGFDGATSLAMPKTVFSYGGSQKPTWQSGQYSGTFPEPMSSTDIGVRFGDLNGDGLTDVVRYHVWMDWDGSPNITHNVRRVHLNKGNGQWDYDVEWDWGGIGVPFMTADDGVTSSSWSYHDMGTRLVDVNGDGKDDVVVAYDAPDYYYEPNMAYGQKGVYLNTGSGFEKADSWTNLTYFSVWNNIEDEVSTNGRELIDVNGDGLPDLVTAYLIDDSAPSAQANTYSDVMLNTGTNWATSSYTFPAPLAQALDSNNLRVPEDLGTRIADINNDGLIDVLRGYRTDSNGSWVSHKDESAVWLNTGSGWATTSSWSIPGGYFIILNYGAKNRGYHLIDVNGDKLVDMVKSRDYSDGQYELHVNTGNGWVSRSHTFPFYLNESYSSYSTGVAVIDFDGDTLVDAWNLQYNDLYETHATGGVAFINEAEVPDQLSGIELSHGGSISLVLNGYVNTNWTTYSQVGTSTMNPAVVESVTYDPGVGASFTTTYDYQKADFHYASTSLRDRKYTGFGKVVESNGLGQKATYYHQGNGNNSASYESNDNIHKAGVAYRQEISSKTNNLYSATVNSIESAVRGTGSTFVYSDLSTTLDYDGDSDHKDKAIAKTYNTTTGLLTAEENLGEVQANLDGTYTNIGSDTITRELSYATNGSGRYALAGEILKNNVNQKMAEKRHYYDGLSLGSLSNGNLTKSEDWISAMVYASSTSTYSPKGLKLSETNPNAKTATFTYDSSDVYLATTTNPLGHKEFTSYDLKTGKLLLRKDANNIIHQFAYDPLGRITKEYIPWPSATTTTKTEYTYVDTKDAASVTKLNRLNSNLNHKEVTHLDGFDRVIQTRLSSENNNEFTVIDRYFGSAGVLEKESLPYFGNGETRTTKTNYAPYYTAYIYDPLGRITSVENIVGDTTTSYDQWAETVTDPLSRQKKFSKDSFGQLVQVDEIFATSTYQTKYEWNQIGNLTKVTDALNNVRNFTYDGRGKQLTSEDLHSSSDTAYGVWQSTYDLVGNRVSTTNPKGQVIVYDYDALNRLLSEVLSGSPSTKITYTYDSCTNGTGRLCIAASVNATSSYQYSPEGYIATETKNIGGTNYVKAQSYDRQGNVVVATYPNLTETRYTYNTGNKIETLKFQNNAGPVIDVIKDFDYGPHGLVTYELHGNGASTTRAYDKDELYRLRSVLTTASTTYGQGGGGNEFSLSDTETDSLIPLVQTMTVGTSRVDLSGMTSEMGEKVATRLSKVSQSLAEKTKLSSTPEAYIHRPYSDDGSLPEVHIKKDKPEIRIQKWGKEVDFGVRYTDLLLEDSQLINGNTMRWYQNDKPEEVHAYPLPISENLPEGGFEFEILLKEKPKRNIFDFNIDGHQDLNFYYQPAPTKTEIAEGILVPENNIGSYAVYHKEKKDHTLGMTNYKTGKVMHIYRPKAVDAAGNEVWGELDYKNGILSVKIPKSYLATAVYPVAVDPTFGYTDAGGRQFGIAASRFLGGEFISPSNYGSFVSLNYRCDRRTGGSYGTKGVIVTKSNLNIVSNGASTGLACPTTGGWATPSFTNAPVVSPNTSYVIGAVAESKNIYFRGDFGGGTVHEDTTNNYAAPQNLGATSLVNNIMSVYVTYNLPNYSPIAPTALQTNNLSNPSLLNDPNPDFSAIFNDQNPGEIGNKYRLQVSTSSSFTSTIWDTGQITLSPVVTAGNRSVNINYAGPLLTSNLAYYWRIKFWDDDGAEGLWSTSTATFSIYSATQSLPPHLKQFMFYEYDDVGNITKIVDAANYNPIASIYEYDALNRLTKFSTSTAQIIGNVINVGTPSAVETYAYNPLGNLLSKSGQGTYLYQGDQTGNYANPHAVTSKNGLTHTYDQNGNLTNITAGPTMAYDHYNRLSSYQSGANTTTYQYDHTGERLKKVGTQTTLYPFNEYEVTGGTQTLNIYAGSDVVATADVTATTTNILHNSRDHLGSTRVVTNDNADTVSDTKYYPFGTKYGTSGTYSQENQYIGEKFDSESQLSYLNARYMDSARGQFTSQDPVFIGLGIDPRTEQALADPQSQNSYSYARNNPIVYKDAEGEWFKEFFTGQQSFSDFQTEIGVATIHMTQNNPTWDWAVSNPKKAGLAVGVTSAAAATPAAAGIANVATIQSGVSLGYVGKMTVGAAAYGYVAKNALESLPEMTTSYSQFKTNDKSTWKAPVYKTATLYGPGGLNSHAGAVYDLYDSIVNLAKDLGLKVKPRENSQTNNKKSNKKDK